MGHAKKLKIYRREARAQVRAALASEAEEGAEARRTAIEEAKEIMKARILEAGRCRPWWFPRPLWRFVGRAYFPDPLP